MGHNRGPSASSGVTCGLKHNNNLNGKKHIPGSQPNNSQRLSNSMLPPNSKMQKTEKITPLLLNTSNGSNNNALNRGPSNESLNSSFSSQKMEILNNYASLTTFLKNVTTTTKLPAIKLKISNQVSGFYKNRILLAKEISRCKPKASNYIKFASLKDDFILIATDNELAYQYLISDWPENAFQHGT
jgi:hypothetical protein